MLAPPSHSRNRSRPHSVPSDNQVANRGVSNFGALSPFHFQPKNAVPKGKVSKQDSKNLATLDTLINAKHPHISRRDRPGGIQGRASARSRRSPVE